MTAILFISKNEKKVIGKLKNKINILETLYNINTKSGDLVSELNPHSLIISTETLLKKTTLIDFLNQVSKRNAKLKIIVIGVSDDIPNVEQYENWSDFLGNANILKNKDDNIEIQIPYNQEKSHSTKSIISLISITTVCALLCCIAISIIKNKAATNDIIVDETSGQVIESSSNTATSMLESQNTAHTSHEVSEPISSSSEITNSENEPVLNQISSNEPTSVKPTSSYTINENSKPTSKPQDSEKPTEPTVSEPPISNKPEQPVVSKPSEPIVSKPEPTTSTPELIVSSKPEQPTSSGSSSSQVVDTKIYLSTSELTLKVGETKNIYVYNAAYGIKVSNTNKAVASISVSDMSIIKVTANAVGTVTLTFTSKYDNSIATCKVNVLPYEE